jgi:hypothetical protein
VTVIEKVAGPQSPEVRDLMVQSATRTIENINATVAQAHATRDQMVKDAMALAQALLDKD